MTGKGKRSLKDRRQAFRKEHGIHVPIVGKRPACEVEAIPPARLHLTLSASIDLIPVGCAVNPSSNSRISQAGSSKRPIIEIAMPGQGPMQRGAPTLDSMRLGKNLAVP